jgi:hypothetical protein
MPVRGWRGLGRDGQGLPERIGLAAIILLFSENANLVVDWVLDPEPAEEADLWPEIRYDADVSPSGWNGWRADRRCRRTRRPAPAGRSSP